ncbi:MAG TPA: hypothetical protein PKX92_04220 [Edaphocola sp.]|nr:hypothetical protein [Edaphocola sp.]
MNQQEIEHLIPAQFEENSKVWVYQSSRPFSEQQEKEVEEQVLHFTEQWEENGKRVHSWGKLLFGRFIIIIADENPEAYNLESMNRVLKSIERQYDCRLFDRPSNTFLIKNKAEVLPLNQVQYAIDKGFIQKETLMFNNMVENKKDLLTRWLQPISTTWLAARLNFKEENITE